MSASLPNSGNDASSPGNDPVSAIDGAAPAEYDLLLVDSLGQLSALELVGVLGSDVDGVPGWRESALLLRANTVLWETEWALLGGKLAEAAGA